MSAAALRTQPVPRVLVVEDESAICDVIGDMLEEAGYAVHCVESGEKAYEALDSGRPYAALVIDVNLGAGVTGFDVARHARGAKADVPVVYVSGQVPLEGFDAHAVAGSLRLGKPIDRAELLAGLETLLGGPPVSQA